MFTVGSVVTGRTWTASMILSKEEKVSLGRKVAAKQVKGAYCGLIVGFIGAPGGI
jgi:hypothetical protein